MIAYILKILHPFISFFTETVWNTNKFNNFFKSSLIQADWPETKKQSLFNKNHKEIGYVMEIISNIRSTKAELNITPKLFCDIIFSEKSRSIKKIINNNIDIVKQVGRVNSLLESQKTIYNSIEILILKEKLALSFGKDIDISSQKNRISKKIINIEAKIKALNNKLQNKGYLKNAPKDIVQNDKILLKDLNIEESKLRSIVSSIN